MRSVSVRVRLRGEKRGADGALGEEMPRAGNGETPRNGETPNRRLQRSRTAISIDLNCSSASSKAATFDDLRSESAQAIVELDFDGYAIGGVSVGEPEEEMMRAVESAEPFLPADRPRYAMGLGTPPQMLEMVARGMDMFDCVLPTRLARNGTAFTAAGTLNLKNAEFALDKRPIEENCACPACREFTRGYIRHLIKAEEILGLRLITLHNLHFYLNLMNQARTEIESGTFDQFRKAFVAEYKTRDQ